MTKLAPGQIIETKSEMTKLPLQALNEANKEESHVSFVLKSNITEVMEEISISLASSNPMMNQLFQATHRRRMNSEKCSASAREVCEQEIIILIQLRDLIFQKSSRLRTITGKGVALQPIITPLSEFTHGIRPKFRDSSTYP